ncbi:MAG: hypothetical protein BAJATHORv1_140011 [Candidatus Thorarchaeota archaeon]|nr:MAG: hypothetical protein BAJATHORv1_140011 [Candidatus Thorarchaeota archaeon]
MRPKGAYRDKAGAARGLDTGSRAAQALLDRRACSIFIVGCAPTGCDGCVVGATRWVVHDEIQRPLPGGAGGSPLRSAFARLDEIEQQAVDLVRRLVLHPMPAAGDVPDGEIRHPLLEAVGQRLPQGHVVLSPDEERG